MAVRSGAGEVAGKVVISDIVRDGWREALRGSDGVVGRSLALTEDVAP